MEITGTSHSYAERYFCPTCGSPVFARTGDEIEIHLGCLDTPNQLRPSYESWTVRRESWLPEFIGMKHYDWGRDATGRNEEEQL